MPVTPTLIRPMRRDTTKLPGSGLQRTTSEHGALILRRRGNPGIGHRSKNNAAPLHARQHVQQVRLRAVLNQPVQANRKRIPRHRRHKHASDRPGLRRTCFLSRTTGSAAMRACSERRRDQPFSEKAAQENFSQARRKPRPEKPANKGDTKKPGENSTSTRTTTIRPSGETRTNVQTAHLRNPLMEPGRRRFRERPTWAGRRWAFTQGVWLAVLRSNVRRARSLGSSSWP